MAEIDSLEIKLQSNIQAVTKDLEQLIGKITLTSKAIASFGNNKALEQLNREAKGVADGMKQAASASGAMKNVSSAASAAQKPMEQLRKSVDETAKELYAKFENFTPVINFSQSAESLKKLSETYQDQMVKAQNELNRIMASSSADKQVKGMERYIIRIQEAKNGIKAINDYLDRMSNKPVQSFSIDSQETVDSAQEIETRIASIKQSIESLQALPKGMITQGLFDAFKNDLAWIQENAPQEVNVINDLSSALQNLKIIGNNSGGGVRSLDELKKRADDLANNIQLVKSLMQDLQNQRKDISINIKDTYKQNLDELKSNLEEIKNVYNVEYTPKVNIDNAKNKIQEFQDALDSIRPEEFTGNFFEMEKYVDGLNQRLDSLTKRFDKLSSLGVSPDTQRLHDLQYEIESVVVTLNKYEAELDKARKAGQLDIKIPSIDSQINRVQGSFNKLQNTMRGAKVVIPTDSLKKVEAEIERVKKKYDQTVESINRKAQTVQFYGTSTDYKNKMIELEALRNKYQELINKQSQLSKIGGGGLTFNTKGFTDGVKNLQKALAPVEKTLQRVNKFINSFAKRIASIVSPMKKASKATDGFGKNLSMNFRTILKYGFGIRSLFVLFNRLRAAITEGMTNLIQYSAATNRSLSIMNSSLNQTKNSLAAAFAPIINAIAPAVNYLIQLLIKAINVINQFFAAITGGSTWIRAKYVYEDVAAGISGVGSSAEDAAKKIKGSLQSFDALNNLTTQDNADAGGGGGSILPEDMFETLPINDKIKEFADKVKDILKRLFAPIKKAWDREGKFVMDSWEKALKNVWALIKDIGRDFLRVWEQDATVDVLANILHIIGDIGLVVANLAERFRIAWNTNEVGFHIFEKIRDIIGIIVQHIRNAADATVEWSAKLDFYPLLDAFDRFLESIKPVVDAVYGVMEDFYTQVLLPLGKWTLEKGLPELLQVFIDFNNKVDWEGLRQSLSELWEHLEPFAETVGEGLILFIERVSDALADFLNSQEFKDFLKSVEDWMDSVTPEDVANTLENVAKAVVGIKAALAGWPVIEGFIAFVGAVAKLLIHAKQAKQIKELGEAIKGLGSASAAKDIAETAASTGKLSEAIGWLKGGAIVGASAAGLEVFTRNLDKVAEATGRSTDQAERLTERYKGLSGKFTALGDGFNIIKNGIEGYGFAADNASGQGVALEKAMKQISDGAILSDEHLAQLQQRFSLTADDMEMLRQSMLDANPELREIAENFGLFDASAQTLGQIDGSMKLVNDRILETSELSDKMKDFIPVETTEQAQAFFDAVSSGKIDLDGYISAVESGQQTVQGLYGTLDSAKESMQGFNTEVSNVGATISSSFGSIDSTILSNSITTAIGIAKETVYPQAQEAGKYLSGGIAEGMSLADLSSPAQTAFDSVLTAFNIAAGINSPAENMKPSGQYLMEGLVEGFKNKIESFGAPITQLITSITTKFTGAIGTVKNAWNSIWSGLPSIMVNIFNSISSSLSSFISSIGNKLSSLASSVRNAFSNIGSGVKGAFSGLSSKLSRNISLSVPNVSFNIPQFATGGFPEDGLFFANHNELVGEFSNGQTAVANNSQITAGIEEAAYRGFMRAMSSMGGFNSNVSVTLEGDAAGLFSVVKEEYRKGLPRTQDSPAPGW